MNSTDVLRALLETALSGSGATAVVLLLRRPVREWLGATAAYALWWLVPVAIVAVLLPAPVRDAARAAPLFAFGAARVSPDAGIGDPGIDATAALMAAWLSGVLGTMALLWRRQRRFLRRLGPLRRRADGLYQAVADTEGLPAAIGLLRARIVLPADFERRYDPRERELVIEHERCHLRRGDLAFNGMAALLRCLHWFNPLLHYAVARMRFDQELACDEAVIARYPGARRRYGEAMLKTRFDPLPLPVGCHWQARHPLKERIAMLKRPSPRPIHSIIAAVSILGLAAGVGWLAWTAQPAPPPEAVAVAAPTGDDGSGAAGIDAMPDRREAAGPGAGDGDPLRYQTRPQYPKRAVEQRISGRVVAIAHVGPDGAVTGVEVESAEPAGVFDQAVIDAVRRWTFAPATQDGRPVAGRVRIPVTFRMDDEDGAADGDAPAEEGRAPDAIGLARLAPQ